MVKEDRNGNESDDYMDDCDVWGYDSRYRRRRFGDYVGEL